MSGAFSRHYRGQFITVDVIAPSSSDKPVPQVIARRVPLVGITAERSAAGIVDVQIMVGNGDSEHLVHVVNNPTRVHIAQVSNGADELLLIDTAAGQATRLDFSPSGLAAGVFVDEAGAVECL